MFLNFLLVETDQPGDGSSSSSSSKHNIHSTTNGNGNGSTGGTGTGGAVPYFSVKDAAELGQALRK